MKFRIADPLALEQRLERLGIRFGPEIEECDTFYRHPVRDFGKTDEGLRIRRTAETLPVPRHTVFLTYKGPKIDPKTKTRREIEITLPEETATASPSTDSGATKEGMPEILEALGFTVAGHVRKYRRSAPYRFKERDFHVLWDRLPDLPDLYLELEVVADASEMQQARSDLLELADALGLAETVRTSYFGLLQERKEPLLKREMDKPEP